MDLKSYAERFTSLPAEGIMRIVCLGAYKFLNAVKPGWVTEKTGMKHETINRKLSVGAMYGMFLTLFADLSPRAGIVSTCMNAVIALDCVHEYQTNKDLTETGKKINLAVAADSLGLIGFRKYGDQILPEEQRKYN